MKWYFRVAARHNIVDKPNHRTLHDGAIIRGGGVVFPVSVLLYALVFRDFNVYLLIGLIMVSTLSFLDDLNHIPTVLRIIIQFVAVSLITYDVFYTEIYWAWFPLALILAVGVLNAYNFMDGINGITGGYSFVTVISLIVLNGQYNFMADALLWSVLTALIVFNYFNFRKKAVCFAGDVGSISIAFIILYALFHLVSATHNLVYILLLSVYGVDSVLTIIQRIIKKENIFEAHRSHLFQVVVFNGKKPHLLVSLSYMIVQAFINYLIITNGHHSFLTQLLLSLIILLALALVYFILKKAYLKKN